MVLPVRLCVQQTGRAGKNSEGRALQAGTYDLWERVGIGLHYFVSHCLPTMAPPCCQGPASSVNRINTIQSLPPISVSLIYATLCWLQIINTITSAWLACDSLIKLIWLACNIKIKLIWEEEVIWHHYSTLTKQTSSCGLGQEGDCNNVSHIISYLQSVVNWYNKYSLCTCQLLINTF